MSVSQCVIQKQNAISNLHTLASTIVISIYLALFAGRSSLHARVFHCERDESITLSFKLIMPEFSRSH